MGNVVLGDVQPLVWCRSPCGERVNNRECMDRIRDTAFLSGFMTASYFLLVEHWIITI